MGQVFDSFGQPVSSAAVTLAGAALAPGPASIRLFTTSEGQFVFTDLPKGTYRLTASKPGYSEGAFGRQRPDGTPQVIELADNDRRAGIRVTVWKAGAIVGTVYDDAGEPLVGATIWSLTRSYSRGRAKFLDGPSATTDDRGVYRLANLPPADYALCVVAAQSTMPASLVESFAAARAAGNTNELQRQYSSGTIGFNGRIPTAGIRVGDAVLHTVGPYSSGMIPPAPGEDGQIWSYQTTCHPAVVGVSRAELVTLTPAEERTGVDIRLRLSPGVPISGVVMGPDGPVANAGVRLAGDFANDMEYELTWESALTISDASGRFTFLGVPAGQYTLRAFKAPLAAAAAEFTQIPGTSFSRPVEIPAASTAEPTLWANVRLDVGAEGAPNLTVRMQSGFRVTGRVQFEGKADKPAAEFVQNLRLTLEPSDGHQLGYDAVARGRFNPDGTFSTLQIPPGRYFVRPAGGGPSTVWRFKSVTLNGRDVSVVPLELGSDVSAMTVVFSDTWTELSGRVRDESGRADPATSVIVFPTEQSEWSNFGLTPRRLLIQRVRADGSFSMTSLPPGNYYVAALDDAVATHWRDPKVLQALTRVAEQFTLADGEKKRLDVVSRKPRCRIRVPAPSWWPCWSASSRLPPPARLTRRRATSRRRRSSSRPVPASSAAPS